MKQVIFGVLVLFTVLAQADERTSLIHYPIGSNLGADKTAIVYDDGTLEVSVNFLNGVRAGGVSEQGRFVLAQVDLAEDVFRDLFYKAAALSDAELKESYSRIICMIAVVGPPKNLSVRTEVDYKERTASGVLRTVLTQDGCWVKYHAEPKQRHARNAAYELKGAINALALQALAENELLEQE